MANSTQVWRPKCGLEQQRNSVEPAVLTVRKLQPAAGGSWSAASPYSYAHYA